MAYLPWDGLIAAKRRNQSIELGTSK